MIDHHGDEWLTVRAAAQRLHVAPGTVRSWVARGKVRAHRIGRRWWVRWDDALDAEHDTRGRYLALRGGSTAH